MSTPHIRSMQAADRDAVVLRFLVGQSLAEVGAAFGTGEADPKGETLVWQLIRFIRHLPALTPDELSQMESLNTL